jgi:putative membrane protein
MFIDWALASFHHLAIFTLAATLAAELAILTVNIDAMAVRRLARIDTAYGVAAAVVVIAGVLRVFFGAKGYEYYIANHIFWTKMALFLIVGLLSIVPTLRYLKWARQLRADSAFRPAAAEIGRMRRYLWAEAAFFLAIPVAAAAMARGYGL